MTADSYQTFRTVCKSIQSMIEEKLIYQYFQTFSTRCAISSQKIYLLNTKFDQINWTYIITFVTIYDLKFNNAEFL